MSNGDITTINLPGLGQISYVECLASGGSLFDCSPLGEFISFFSGLFSGVPKMLKTQEAQQRLAQSQLWQFQALATNLEIWVRNSVPLSTGDPVLRAQLTNWIHGTIYDSGLGLRVQPNGYNQFAAVDTTLWRVFASQYAYSGKALDQLVLNFQRVNAELDKKPPPPPPPPPKPKPKPPPPPPPPPPDGLCESGNDNQDEILDLCQAVNGSLAQILAAIQGLTPAGNDEACCNAVTAAVAACAQQLAIIATALLHPPNTGPGIDLAPIVAALQDLVTAIAAYPPALQTCCAAITGQLGAIATALGPDAGKAIQNIADAINQAALDDKLPAAMVDEMVKNGSMPAPIAQFFSDRPASWSLSGLVSGIGHFLFGGVNPNMGRDVADNIKAVGEGLAAPNQPIHSLVDVPFYLLAVIGTYWSRWAVDIGGALLPAALSAAKQIGTAVTDQIPGGPTGVVMGIGAPAVAALKYVQSAPAPGELITTSNYQSVVQDAMGRAGLMGGTAWVAAMVGGFLMGPWEKYWGEIAAMIATSAGFEEISARWMAPFLDAVIAHRARQDANTKWPTMVPPGTQALALWSRRKIVDADRDTLLGYAGLDPAWRPAMEAGAFRPVTPFVLASAFVDQPIDRATILDILKDNAYSDAHANTMADAIVYKSIANVRNSYLSAVVSAYGKGVTSDAELDDVLTEFNFAPLAKQYVKNHVLILRREVLAAEAEKTVVPLVANGNITPDEGLQQLEAAGVQPWYANLQITLATTRATIHAAKLEAAAERRAQLATQRNLTRAAVAEYQSGAINDAGLTAALIALGLDASLVTSIVAVQDATRQGRLRLVYGQLLSPADAKLLTERVAAIAQQTKDQLITLDQARAQLTGLKVDDAEAQALLARWAASLKKNPGAAVLLTP